MYLAIIEPEKPGFDLRTFECPRCQHVETVVVNCPSQDDGLIVEHTAGSD